MAQAPHRPNQKHESEPEHAAPVAVSAPKDETPKDERVKTIADEQRERSAYDEEHGIGSHADLTPQSVEPRKQVAGVSPTSVHVSPTSVHVSPTSVHDESKSHGR